VATSRRMELSIVTASTLHPERAASPNEWPLFWRWRLANLSRRARDGQPESGGPSWAVWIWLGGKRPRLLPARRTVVTIGGVERSL
jgi:hypothetical protein